MKFVGPFAGKFAMHGKMFNGLLLTIAAAVGFAILTSGCGSNGDVVRRGRAATIRVEGSDTMLKLAQGLGGKVSGAAARN